jgi:hypothetical protein
MKSLMKVVRMYLNSKCIDLETDRYVRDPEVRIIQKFDYNKVLVIPRVDLFLFREFGHNLKILHHLL